MQKIFVFIALFLVFSCSDDDDYRYDILPNIPVDETIFLNNPEFIDLQVPGGWAYANGGISGIIIYRSGGSTYLAFERSAPHLKPQSCSQMKVVNGIKMVCSCDDSEFQIIDGAPMTDGVDYAARQYRVDLVGNNTLRITNY
ncbi:MAG: hypothetical protein ABFR05_13510 [Bacteroidota bacterium]